MERGKKKSSKRAEKSNKEIEQEIIEIKEHEPHEINLVEETKYAETPVQTSAEEYPSVKKQRNLAGTLVFLIIILILIDAIALAYYFKFDFSVLFKPKATSETLSDLKCRDGTPYNYCSKEKPNFCYNGELMKKAATCGCPEGYKVDFQDCKKI